MTADELIEQLKHLPPHTKIVVSGYEEGYRYSEIGVNKDCTQ